MNKIIIIIGSAFIALGLMSFYINYGIMQALVPEAMLGVIMSALWLASLKYERVTPIAAGLSLAVVISFFVLNIVSSLVYGGLFCLFGVATFVLIPRLIKKFYFKA